MFPGRIIANRYRVLRVLGRGGMGVVSEVEAIDTAERYAIKFLREDVEADMQPSARFLREAKLATRLQSPHSCRVIAFGDWDLGLYIVMELLEGRSLYSVLERGRQLDWRQVVRIAYEMCDALAEAHALGIVHRDVKPGNVYLAKMPGGRVATKVLDFGVAKIPGSVVTKHGEPSLTDASTLLGTPSYVAPEQLMNSKLVDARADIWAVGVMLYEMLSGQLPFTSPLVPKLLVMIAKGDHLPLASLVPAVPPDLVHIVHRCLFKDPSLRFADARALAQELLPWLDSTDDLLLPLLRLASTRPSLRASEPPASEPTEIEESNRCVSDSLDPHTTANFGRHQRVPRSRVRYAAAGASLGVLSALLYFSSAPSLLDSRAAPNASLMPPLPLAPAKAEMHHVLLLAGPAQARMQLDGTTLETNPANVSLANDGKKHQLVVSAPGFVTERRALLFNVDQQLTVSLRQIQAEPSGPAAAAPPVARSRPLRPRPTRPNAAALPASKSRLLDQENPF